MLLSIKKVKEYINSIPKDPFKSIDQNIYDELINYPIDFCQIIECCLKAEREINSSLKYLHDECNDQYVSVVRPAYASSTAFGSIWEHEIRHRLNKLGIIQFVEGDHNSGEDCTCIDNNYWSIEIKTRCGSLSFNNTNDSNRTHISTKYDNNGDLDEHFYILIAHRADMSSQILQTHSYKIFFGKLCKRDFTNPNGSGAAFLKSEIRDSKCIEIWNERVGNTIDAYQSYLDNEYVEKLLEVENERF